jgi:hypothetical protein
MMPIIMTGMLITNIRPPRVRNVTETYTPRNTAKVKATIAKRVMIDINMATPWTKA